MKFFLVFHHNLAFSSIPEEHYPYLIDCVYGQLLGLVEEGFPLGLEFTGETLEIINRLRPQYIERLRNIFLNDKCEIIGSSYSQAIFPLIPARVNRWNIEFGIEVYRHLLDTTPDVFYLNEQVYSESMPQLYIQAGASALMLDWMSACKGNDWPVAYRYQPVRHNPSGLKLLWADSIAFQKLQRAVWGDIDAEDWLAFVEQHRQAGDKFLGEDSHFCLYASDAEIFDYYPGRLTTYGAKLGHFDRLRSLLEKLRDNGGELILPGEAAASDCAEVAGVGTAEYPVRTKKQDKYNVLRWAVTGREAAKINTQCYQLLDLLDRYPSERRSMTEFSSLCRALVSLWGSDFRTHTTDEKYEVFHNRMGLALAEAATMADIKAGCGHPTEEEPGAIWKLLQKGTGGTEDAFVKINGRRITLSAHGQRLTLLKNKGLAIEALVAENVSQQPLIGTIPHGHFADITLGSDFFSGHLVLVTQEGRQYTDLSRDAGELELRRTGKGLFLRNRQPMVLPGIAVQKTYLLDKDGLRLVYDLYATDLRPASLRLGFLTLAPESFTSDSLWYAVYLGGDRAEKYHFRRKKMLQDAPVNSVVTARHCLGNTSGVLRLGDAEKSLQIKTDAKELYSVPLLHFEKAGAWNRKDSFFLRVCYSICERDDVANVFWKGHFRISFRLSCTSPSCRQI